jgi:hypothetical protein
MALPPRIARTVSRPPRKKRPGASRAHLDWIKTLPCCVCLARANDPHHLLGNVDGLPKGMGRKNEDRWAIPVCRKHHVEAHAAGNDEEWFVTQGIDARALASALWRVTGENGAGLRLVFRCKLRIAA